VGIRLFELVAGHLAGVDTVLDARPEPELAPVLPLVARVRHERCPLENIEPATVGRGRLLVAPTEADRAGEDVVERVGPGGRAVLVVTGPPLELPVPRLLSTVGAAGCQVRQVATLQEHPPAVGVVVERVDHVLPALGYLAAADASGADVSGAGEREHLLRLVNEFVLADYVSRRVRVRVQDLEAAEEEWRRTAEQLAEARTRMVELDERVAGLESEQTTLRKSLRELTAELAAQRSRADAQGREAEKVAARLAALQASTTWQVGRVVVDVARNPATALRLPAELLPLWWRRRRGAGG
jgi:hypothetical protein